MIWALALALAGERVALGVWHRWAAIREAGSVGGAGPRRCFAIAQPVLPGGDSDRRGALVGDRATARAPDAATDRAILNAIRSARAMTLVTLDAAGRTIADTYPLAGAATAIDAAQLGCR